MTIFIAEREVAAATQEQIAALQRAALRTSERFTAEGRPVRYLRSLYVPTDARLLCHFEASDAGDVRDVNEAAQLSFTRIVEAFEFIPISET